MNPIEILKMWHSNSRAGLSEKKIESEFSMVEENQSARLDIEGPNAIGRVTVWTRGMCDVEVLDTEAGSQRLWKHLEAVTRESLDDALSEVS